MFTNTYPSDAEMARLAARMFWEIGAVHFRPEEPYIFTSGIASPVYIDGRKLISFPRIRSALMDFACTKITRDVDADTLITALAGADGTTAPARDFILENMSKRMADNLREEMADAGQIKAKDGEAAMSAVVAAIRAAADAGEITLITEDDEED